MSQNLKEKALQFYHRHEAKVHVAFFLCGFTFDYFAAGEVDDLFMLAQQVVYLLLICMILSMEHLIEAGVLKLEKMAKIWQYRSPLLHFCLGTILNLYSFFFLKSSSVFTSLVFVVFLLALIITNEMPRFKKSRLNARWSLWVLCLFSFFSVIFPLILGFVGWLTFLLAASSTVLCLYLHTRWMMRYQKNFRDLLKSFVQPGVGVVGLFVILYFLRLIPPVPLAVQGMGVYHQLEKREGKYILSFERPFWKFWETGDQTFLFRNGDPIFFFAKIFSPSRFSDEVIIHWLYQDPKQGWITSDQVKMQISGGRHQGFRGYSVKRNYQPGSWRVQVETTDGREIGRLYIHIEPDPGTEERVWSTVEY